MKILLARPVHERPHEIVPDLGLGYLATSLMREGHHVRILDCSKEGLDHSGFADVLKKGGYDLVGLKIFSNEFSSSAKMIRITKKQDRKPWVVVGGPHVSGSPRRTMECVKEADFGFQGEAEVGFPMLVKSIHDRDNSSYSEIPGLIFREEKALRVNPQVFPQDLDELGMPSWSLMPPRTYPKESFGLFVKNFPTAPIITTRGCPFHCTYCAGYRVTGRRFRKRSIDRIIEELSLLKGEFGVKDFTIVDDNFTLQKPFALAVCEAILRNRLDLSWSCPNGVRLDTLDRELIQAMEASGCYSVAVGIESGSERVLAAMKKSLRIHTVREKVDLIKSCSRIKVTGFFLLGYPSETRSDIEKTIRLSRQLNLDRGAFSLFNPFPGTEIYEELLKKGSIEEQETDTKGIDYDSVSVGLKDLNGKELKRLQKRAVLRFYLRPRVLWGILKELKSFDQVKVLLRRLYYAMK
jgi:radical SAM superfamily enzyme YgiQ (UPF0313 family)